MNKCSPGWRQTPFAEVMRNFCIQFSSHSQRYWECIQSHSSTGVIDHPVRQNNTGPLWKVSEEAWKNHSPCFLDASCCYFPVLLSMASTSKLWLFSKRQQLLWQYCCLLSQLEDKLCVLCASAHLLWTRRREDLSWHTTLDRKFQTFSDTKVWFKCLFECQKCK